MSSEGETILPLPTEIRGKLRDMTTMSEEERREYIRELIRAAHDHLGEKNDR